MRRLRSEPAALVCRLFGEPECAQAGDLDGFYLPFFGMRRIGFGSNSMKRRNAGLIKIKLADKPQQARKQSPCRRQVFAKPSYGLSLFLKLNLTETRRRHILSE
jgi:hypothetical protein